METLCLKLNVDRLCSRLIVNITWLQKNNVKSEAQKAFSALCKLSPTNGCTIGWTDTIGGVRKKRNFFFSEFPSNH